MAFFGRSKNATASTASRGGSRTPTGGGNSSSNSREYKNADGPGGSTVNYGARRGAGPGANARNLEEWGESDWYGDDGKKMGWSGPAGQQRGQRAPTYTPNAGDPRNDGYWKNAQTPEQQAQWQATQDVANAARKQAFAADPAIASARAAGDMRAYIAALMNARQGAQEQRFIDQGGTSETWKNRNAVPWPVPKPGGGAGGGTGGGGGGAAPAPPANKPAPPPNTVQTFREQTAARDRERKTSQGMPAHLLVPGRKPSSTSQPSKGVRRGGGRVDY